MTHPQQPDVGVETAIELARRAADRVPAYRKFLESHGIDPNAINTAAFRTLPPMTKDTYIKCYDPPELVWDGDLGRVVNWSSSSGSSGSPTVWPRSRRSLYDSIQFHEQILRDSFGASDRTTLAINTFAMSTWIAGAYTLMALNGANDLEIPVSVISPGINTDDAVRALSELAPNYQQVVIAGYPPHVKDVLDTVASVAPAALDQDIKLLLAGELITETWRDHLLNRIGKIGDPSSITLIYGTADAGLMGFETPLSVDIRRAAHSDPQLQSGLFGDELTHLPTFVEYNPVSRYVETDEDGFLLFTIDTTLPLVRYRIKDLGEVYSGPRMRELLEAYGYEDMAGRVTDQHFMTVAGRPDVEATFYAVNIYYHNIQPVVEDPRVVDQLSGYFHLPHPENADLSQTLRIMFELKDGVEETDSLHETLERITLEKLTSINGEYHTLYNEKGERALPVVSIHKYRERPEFDRKPKQNHVGRKNVTHRAEILHPAKDADRIRQLLDVDDYAFVDGWDSALEDLRELDQYRTDPPDYDADDLDSISRHIVYPWRRTVVRLPEDALYYRLRTARNRFLITDEEQQAWAAATVAIAGLSVGGSVLSVCSLTGARRLRIADPDTLGPTNLNRLAGSVCDLGTPKTTLAYRRVIEADPYAAVEIFPDGFHPEIAGGFLGGSQTPRADVLIEEMDDLAMKVRIRQFARAARIPVVMVTDDGDNVILDIERFDLEPDRPLFHGRAEDIESMTDDQLRDRTRRVEIAGMIAGDDVDDRLKVALGEVGKSIPSWPQLGTAATLAGVVGAIAARQIVCGVDLPSGRRRVQVSNFR